MLSTEQDTITTHSPQQIRRANAAYFLISGFGYTTWASRIPSIQQQLHLNNAQLGAALLALPVGLMATMPVTGVLLRRYSSSRIMLFGAVGFNIMLGLLGYAGHYWQLLLVLFCFGSSRNLLNLSTNTQAVQVQRLFDRSIMTTFHGIWSTAGFAGAALGYLMVSMNILPLWHLLTVSTTLIIMSFYFYPKMLHDLPGQITEKRPLFSWPDRTLLKFAIICFTSMACENIMYDWSEIYLQQSVHTNKTMATAGFVVFMVAVTSGRFLGDRLVNSYGVKPILKYCSGLVVSGFVLTVALPNVASVISGFALIGLGVSCMVPLVYSQAGKSKTMSSGAALASVSTIGYLGFLIVPPMVGFVAQAASLRAAFGIITLLGLVMMWMTAKIEDRDENLHPDVNMQ